MGNSESAMKSVHEKTNEEKKKLINDILNKNFIDAFINSKNEKEFEQQMKKDIPMGEINNEYIRKFFNLELEKKKSTFLKDREDKKKLDEFLEKQKIDTIINNHYYRAKNCINEKAFINYYDNLQELEELKWKNLESYKSCISIKLEWYKSDKETERTKINNFYLKNYEKALSNSSNENDFKNYFGNIANKDMIQLINNNIYYFYELFEKDDEKIKKDLKEKSLKKYETDIKSFFDYYYNEIKKNSNSVFQFEKKFLEKKRQFFYSDLENGIFENLYNQIYSKYKNQYIEETKRNNEIKTYKKKTETLEIKEKIRSFFDSNYQNALNSSDEIKFREFYDKKQDNIIKKYLKEKEFAEFYDEQMGINTQKFIKDLESKKIIAKNIINTFFKENYNKNTTIYLTEKIFEKNLEKYQDNNIKKYLKNKEYNDYYKELLSEYYKILKEEIEKKKNEENIENQKKIESFFIDNYSRIFKGSENVEQFENNINEEFKSKYYNRKLIRNYENKKIYEKLISQYKEKFNEYIGNKQNTEYIKISMILEENYNEAMKKSKTKNEFILFMEEKVGELKNSEHFQNLLKSKVEKFQREKQEESDNTKKIEITKEFNSKKDDIKKNYFMLIEKENYEDYNCINLFINYLNDKSKIILDNIFSQKNYDSQIKDKILLQIKLLLNDKNNKINHLNIILVGNTGVGKSTLINSILELEGDEKVKTGAGKSVTKETEFINSKKFPIFRCADTRGTEITFNGTNSYGITEVKEEIKNFIEKQLQTKDPDKYIHCIWYCVCTINGRFQDSEEQLLKELGSLYTSKELPIIIVGTKSFIPQFNEQFIEILKSLKIDYPFCLTVAQECKKPPIEIFGIKELRILSIEKAMGAIESACYQGIFKNVIKTVNSTMDDYKKIIHENVIKEKEKILEVINSGNIKKEMKNILNFIYNQYSSFINSNNKDEINNNDKIIDFKVINEFINNYYYYCQKCYEKSLKNIIDYHISKLSDQIIEEQLKYNKNYNNAIETKEKKQIINEIKHSVKEKLFKKAEKYYLSNIFNEYVNALLEMFPSYFNDNCKKCIIEIENDNEIKKFIFSKISNQFEELKKKVEEFNQNGQFSNNDNDNKENIPLPEKCQLMKIENEKIKDKYIHKENIKKLNYDHEKDIKENELKIKKEDNIHEFKMKKMEYENQKNQMDNKIEEMKINAQNDDSQRNENIEKQKIELEKKKIDKEYDINELNIKTQNEINKIKENNDYKIKMQQLDNNKELNKETMNYEYEKMKLEYEIKNKIIDKLSNIPPYNAMNEQLLLSLIQNQYLNISNNLQNNSQNIPLNPQQYINNCPPIPINNPAIYPQFNPQMFLQMNPQMNPQLNCQNPQQYLNVDQNTPMNNLPSNQAFNDQNPQQYMNSNINMPISNSQPNLEINPQNNSQEP